MRGLTSEEAATLSLVLEGEKGPSFRRDATQSEVRTVEDLRERGSVSPRTFSGDCFRYPITPLGRLALRVHALLPEEMRSP